MNQADSTLKSAVDGAAEHTTATASELQAKPVIGTIAIAAGNGDERVSPTLQDATDRYRLARPVIKL